MPTVVPSGTTKRAIAHLSAMAIAVVAGVLGFFWVFGISFTTAIVSWRSAAVLPLLLLGAASFIASVIDPVRWLLFAAIAAVPAALMMILIVALPPEPVPAGYLTWSMINILTLFAVSALSAFAGRLVGRTKAVQHDA